jgi:hypothetical protein
MPWCCHFGCLASAETNSIVELPAVAAARDGAAAAMMPAVGAPMRGRGSAGRPAAAFLMAARACFTAVAKAPQLDTCPLTSLDVPSPHHPQQDT